MLPRPTINTFIVLFTSKPFWENPFLYAPLRSGALHAASTSAGAALAASARTRS